MTSLDDCRLIELPRIPRPEGALTPIEGGRDIPFDIARVYYLYDIPAGVERGGHAHRQLEQLFVSVMGAFTVILRDGRRSDSFELNRGHTGLFVPRLIWREIINFSTGSVCVVLASARYDEADYVRSWDEFLVLRGAADGG